MFADIDGRRAAQFVNQFSFIREAGKSGEKKAADVIIDTIKSFGAFPQKETFDIDIVESIEASLTVYAPLNKVYIVTGYGFCKNTSEDGIEADIFYAENADPVNLSRVSGKIVIVNGPVDTELCRRLEQAGAVAFLAVSGIPIDSGMDRKPAIRFFPQNKPGSLPGASIHCIDAAEIIESGADKAQFYIKQINKKKTSQNIIVHIDGTEKSNEIISITAHYDSVPAGPGAYDNMAGAAIIMELCRYFNKYRPKRSMEFIWLGAEERGLLGSMAYVHLHENELSRHVVNLNVDLAGQLIGATVAGVTGDLSLCTLAENVSVKCGIGVTVKQSVWSSDSNTFAWKGIPALTLNRDGFGMHTRYDTADLISPWSLKRSSEYLCSLSLEISDSEEVPFNKKIPDEFNVKLNKYFTERYYTNNGQKN